MKISQFKNHLDNVPELNFLQPNGDYVPKHFHITEAGMTTKHFVDCGGTVRTEKTISFQLWVAEDHEHRLEPQKLKKIIGISENLFGEEDLKVEIEYQKETIGRYGLYFNGTEFLLTPKQTNCLAKDNCGISTEKPKIKLSELKYSQTAACCAPGTNCC